MAKIRFERTQSDLAFLNPFKEFAEDSPRVEIRLIINPPEEIAERLRKYI